MQLVPPILLALAAIGTCYAWSDVRWGIRDGRLDIAWRTLGVLPLGSWSIPVERIQDVRPSSVGDLVTSDVRDWTRIVGPVLRRKLTLVVLERRRFVRPRFAIAVRDGDALAAAIRAARGPVGRGRG